MQSSENQLEIVAYDPDWLAAFDAEADCLRTALGPLALRIDHNGSTSIPGLGAKPIIDIPAAARDYEELKRDLAGKLAATTNESCEAYAQAKTDFIERILEVALSSGYPLEPFQGEVAQIVGSKR